MLLTFSVLYGELMSQTKKQTIRKNWKRWQDFYDKKKHHPGGPADFNMIMEGCRVSPHSNRNDYMKKHCPYLNMWWKNPRNGGTHIGDALLIDLKVKRSDELTQEDAINDGFDNIEELLKALRGRNGHIKPEDKWAVLTFDWLHGPFPLPAKKNK